MADTDSPRPPDPSPPPRWQARPRGMLVGAVLVAGAAAGASGVKLAERWQP